MVPPAELRQDLLGSDGLEIDHTSSCLVLLPSYPLRSLLATWMSTILVHSGRDCGAGSRRLRASAQLTWPEAWTCPALSRRMGRFTGRQPHNETLVLF